MTVTGDNLLLGVAPAASAGASAFGGGSTAISQRRISTTVMSRMTPTATSWARTLAPAADAADPTTAPPVKPRLHIACSRFMIDRPTRCCTITP